jgi:hypothetical protein
MIEDAPSLNIIRAASCTAGHAGSVIRMFRSNKRQVLKDGVLESLTWACSIVGLGGHCSNFKIQNGLTSEASSC